jgi:hypothetical protein
MMKKVLLFLGLGLFVLVACSKEYTCSCGVSGTVKSKDYKTYNTKRQSKENCDALNGDTISIEGISGIAECEIIGLGS